MAWIDDIQPSFATVVGKFVSIDMDGDDTGQFPDVQPLSGTIVLTPTTAAGRINDVLAQILRIEVEVFGGQIVDAAQAPGVRILATDTDIGIIDWAWKAEFDFRRGGPKLKPLTFKAPAGTTVNLTAGIVPVDSAPYQIVEGPAGPQGRGITALEAVEGGMSVTYTDGATETIPVTGMVVDVDAALAAYTAEMGA